MTYWINDTCYLCSLVGELMRLMRVMYCMRVSLDVMDCHGLLWINMDCDGLGLVMG